MLQLLECHSCRYYANHYALFCTVHPSGSPGETCLDYDPDLNLENRQFQDFLGLGEPVDMEDPTTNPDHDDPEENWPPDGSELVEGELRLSFNKLKVVLTN